MDRFSALNLGRLDSVAGVSQSQTAKAPSLAGFLAQRADQVLGAQKASSPAVETQALASETPSVPEQTTPVNARLARQMDQMRRLHSSISLPSNDQGISVLA